MARKDALLRLHQRLLMQRDEIRRKLSADMDLTAVSDAGSGDVGDLAFDDAEREVSSQLVALESRELAKIERAILAIREGRYGSCEACSRAIPVERLRALPYTTSCVDCQRTQELRGRDARYEEEDWESAYEYQARQNDQELTLSDLPLDA